MVQVLCSPSLPALLVLENSLLSKNVTRMFQLLSQVSLLAVLPALLVLENSLLSENVTCCPHAGCGWV